MSKPVVWRIFVGLLIISAALSFQNCGPTFVTNEAGQIQMSSFEGPLHLPTNVPSRVAGQFPSTAKGGFATQNTATNPAAFNLCDSVRPVGGIARCMNGSVTFRAR